MFTSKKKAAGGKHGRPAPERKAKAAKVSERPIKGISLNPKQAHKTPTM